MEALGGISQLEPSKSPVILFTIPLSPPHTSASLRLSCLHPKQTPFRLSLLLGSKAALLDSQREQPEAH